MKRTVWIAALLVLLVAAFARMHRLDAQSLWNDEGNSLRLAQRNVGDLIDAAGRDIHPPGYYLVLKAWIALTGEREFSLRYLSALQGFLTVALTVALGAALGSRSGGLAAGLLVALSPFAVYYSQETRMYAQLGLVAAASMWTLIMGLRRGGPGWIAALAFCNAAGLYTQYSFPFTMLAQGGVVLVWLLRRHDPQRIIMGFALANGIALLLIVPWLPTAWDQVTNWPRTGVDLPLDERLHTVLTWITYGSTAGDINWGWLLLPGLLAALGLIRLRQRAILPLIWIVVIIAALFASGAYREANLKFLLPAQIALALLIGGGAALLAARSKGFTILLLIAVLAGQINALNALYTDPAYARDDYRAIAAHILSNQRPGAAVILDAPNQNEVFSYYYPGPVYALPRGLGGDDAATRAEIEQIIAQHARIFVVFWGETERDPNRVVQAALDAGAYPVTSRWYGDVRLAQYAVLGDAPDSPQVILNTRFGDHITLTGYALSADDLPPGDVLGVTLFWQTDAPLDTQYKVAVQILGPDGRKLAGHDAEPNNNRTPTFTWTPGDTVIDPHGLVIPPDLTSGNYSLIVVLYDINNPQARLLISEADSAPVDHLLLRQFTKN
ncbi:MAG TPA: glycosyltransferase family 39 protein [Aggregatilineaceae bacterium]|nr:glycosyltransferase family 39 protein [Aggregatilineaceae bacterium]